jgi:hypothetical protein
MNVRGLLQSKLVNLSDHQPYLDDVLFLCGAGVGGGSHVYGSTLYVPPKQFFDAPAWAGITDWAGIRCKLNSAA